MSDSSENLRKRCLPLLAFGIVLGAYLVFHTTSVQGGFHTGESVCNLGGSFNCDEVAASKYSKFLGLQVAALGLWYYLCFLGLLFLCKEEQTQAESTRVDLFLVYALLSLPLTLYLGVMSLLKIGYVCIFCLLTYLINILLVVVFSRAPSPKTSFTERMSSGVSQLLNLFFSSKTPGSTSALAWILFLITGFVSLGLPNALEHYYFLPRAEELADRAYLQSFITDWQAEEEQELLADQAIGKDFVLGPDSAPLQLVEFSDFQCPYCKRASHTFKPLIEQFKGKVQLVFKNYPLDSECNSNIEEGGHAYACQAAMVARCAGAQGDEFFWKAHDAIFAMDAYDWSFEALMDIPPAIGLDLAQFDTCLSDPGTKDRIVADIEAGDAAGVEGTPSVFLNGKRLKFSGLEQIPGLLKLILEDLNSSDPIAE